MVWFILPHPGAAETIDTFLNRLAVAGRKTQTLQANFVQKKRLALFRTEVASKGKIYFRQPETLRWETLPPDGSVLLVTGKRAELRLSGEKSRVIDLQQAPLLASLVDQMFVWLGAARPNMNEFDNYQVVLDQTPYLTRVRLTPKAVSLKKRITNLVLEMDKQLLLRQIIVRQTDGDQTTIEFSEVKRNVKLPANAFK